MIKFVPATHDMLRLVAGEIPRQTVRAIAVTDDDVVIGVGGFYFDNKDKVVIFSCITDALRRRPIALVKSARLVMNWTKRLRVPVYAVCDKNVYAAAQFLEHLGFKHLVNDTWLLQAQ